MSTSPEKQSSRRSLLTWFSGAALAGSAAISAIPTYTTGSTLIRVAGLVWTTYQWDASSNALVLRDRLTGTTTTRVSRCARCRVTPWQRSRRPVRDHECRDEVCTVRRH